MYKVVIHRYASDEYEMLEDYPTFEEAREAVKEYFNRFNDEFYYMVVSIRKEKGD